MKPPTLYGRKATRLKPVTCPIPKQLLPVVSKPILSPILEQVTEASFIDINMTSSYNYSYLKRDNAIAIF